jgi:pilus assembly protein Flp/PilA
MPAKLSAIWRDLLASEQAVTAIEYSLIAAVISLAIIVGVTSLGSSTSTTMHTVATRL